MTTERRYGEREIAEIFKTAALPPTSAGQVAPRGDGLTLAELQAIGCEVGLAPERITAAASALDRRGVTVARQTSFGMPLATGRILDLPRALTDREWALLVAELREVFGASGEETVRGDSRQWSNGNLHAVVEPTVDGYRLRLGTRKGDAATVNRLGASGIVLSLATSAGMLLAGEPLASFGTALVMGALGGGAFAYNALRLKGWARERESQMDHILQRAHVIISAS